MIRKRLFNVLKKLRQQMRRWAAMHLPILIIFGIAMLIYSELHLDYCVIETGLGGRLDITNAVEKPVLSIITTISLEHTAILGDNIAAIAKEKAGIIKKMFQLWLWEIF